MADDTTNDFKVGEEVEVFVGTTTPPAWFVGRIESKNEKDKSFSLSFNLFDNTTVEGDKIRPKSELRKDDKVLIYIDDTTLQGVILEILPDGEYKIQTDVKKLTTSKKRNDIGLLNAPSGDTLGSVPASGASSSTPVVPASTGIDKSKLNSNVDYQAYLIAEKGANYGDPISTLKEELNKLDGTANIGTLLENHINNKDYDAEVKTKKKSDTNGIYKSITTIVKIVESLTAESKSTLLRFVKDYRTVEQELLKSPESSPYLIRELEGVHSTPTFVRAVCLKMQERLSGPLKDLYREKRKTDYSTSLEVKPTAIPSVEDLELFFESNPDQSTILLFITMVRSMLNIEPLLKVHYGSIGRALQKTFKNTSLFLNKSNITKGLYGSKEYVSDNVAKQRTEVELQKLLTQVNQYHDSRDHDSASDVIKIIAANIERYKRILGEENEDYKTAQELVIKKHEGAEGKLTKDLPFWRRLRQNVQKYIFGRGGKRTKHHNANRKTRRPQHVMRRKTHHKKRRPMLTRRQLQVRR